MNRRRFIGLPAKAIEAFIDRPRKNFHNWKTVSAKKVEAYVRRLPVRPPIWSILRRPQKICLLIGARVGSFAFFNDTGTGKTLLSVALARYWKTEGQVQKALVLVPRRINKWEWAREIEKHCTVPYLILQGSSEDKWRALEDTDALLVIETYMGMMRMVSGTVPHKRKPKKVMKPKASLVKQLRKHFQMLITDEGTILGRKLNLPTRICRQLVKSALYYNLTGTPFGRDPTLLHSQMRMVDGGYTLGETLALFRGAFYKSSENWWGGVDWHFDKKKMSQLNRFLAHRSIRFEADQADLPKLVRISKHVSLEEDADVYAQKAYDKMLAAKGNYREMKNAFLRMRQISSGFVGFKDDENGTKAQVIFDDNPKLDMLLSIIESIPEYYKVIVFHDFHISGDLICRELAKLEIGHLRVYGLTKHPVDELHKFDHDPKAQVLVLSNAMAIGLNLQVAKYGIFFESPVPVMTRKQAIRRFERQESKHKTVFLYDLICRGTYDQKILDFHKEGGDLFRAIIQGKVRVERS